MKAGAVVARNIRRLRLARGLSQEVLAVDAGIDRTYMSAASSADSKIRASRCSKNWRARWLRISRNFSRSRAPGRAARRLVSGAKHEGQGKGPSSNVVGLRTSRPRPPGTAAVLAGLQLFNVFLKIGSAQDRKKVLDLAKELAPDEAGRKT
jgi:hypothetical protein